MTLQYPMNSVGYSVPSSTPDITSRTMEIALASIQDKKKEKISL